jgi:hypothetical protein
MHKEIAIGYFGVYPLHSRPDLAAAGPPPPQGRHQFDYPKTVKAVFLLIKLSVLTKLPPPCVVSHIPYILI